MNRSVSVFTAVFLLIGAPQCARQSSGPPPEPVREMTAAELQVVQSSSQFGLELFREVVANESGKNVFVSPLSVSMALGMACNGAVGETRDSMLSALAMTGLTMEEFNQACRGLIDLLPGIDPKVVFEIANSIWYRQEFPVQQAFLDVNRTSFDAEVGGLDFGDDGSADIINDWVEDKTHGKISEIISAPIDPLTMMFVINAIYFKGTWSTQFDEEDTYQTEFMLADRSTVQCDMMKLPETELPHYSNELFEAVELPYGNGQYSMIIMVPNRGITTDSLICQLSQKNWDRWLDGFATGKGEVHLPRFTIEYKISLKSILSALGMGVAFDPSSADFSDIAEVPNLHISEVLHKTYVKVNEEGTEAAAVTAVEIGILSAPPRLLLANRPFVFVIRESHSGTLLFMGRVMDPTAG